MEYIGEVITNTEFLRRTRAYEMEGLKHYYFMTLKTDEVSGESGGKEDKDCTHSYLPYVTTLDH
jgi:hypothetical protein